MVVEIITVTICSILVLFSVINNGSVLYLVKTNKELKSVPNYFIASLALADILCPLFTGIPICVFSYFPDIKFRILFCKFFGPPSIVFGSSSIWLLGALTFNRYVAVTKPLKVKTIFTTKRTIYIILVVWLAGIVAAVINFFVGTGYYSTGSKSCTDYNKNRVFVMSLSFVFSFVPIPLIAYMYYAIHRVVKFRAKKIKTLGAVKNTEMRNTSDVVVQVIVPKYNAKIGSPSDNLETESSDSKRVNRLNKTDLDDRKFQKDKKLTIMIRFVVIMFFVANMGLFVSNYAITFKVLNLPESVYHELLVIGYEIYFINGIINPIIYYNMSTNFNKAYKKMFASLFACIPITRNQTNVNENTATIQSIR